MSCTSDVGFYDRVVIQKLINEIAQTQQVSPQAPREYKVVILNEADGLSKDAQHALRRTMEKYMSNLRLFLVCQHLGKIIEPLQSRCILVRIPAPSDEVISHMLGRVAKDQGFSLPPQVTQQITTYAEGNLRKALLSLEVTKVRRYPFADGEQCIIEKTDWEEYLDQLAVFIVQEQSAAR